MNRRTQLFERIRGERSWLIPATLLALTPKCFFCVLSYAGIGTALGLGGPEICGVSGSTTGLWVAWVPVLAGTTMAVRKLKSHP